MHLCTVQGEIQQFEQYKDLLAGCKQVSENSVSFTTLEGAHHTAAFTKDGWLVDPETKDDQPGSGQAQHYETVEALLMAQSPKFREKWNDLLASKLWEYVEKS